MAYGAILAAGLGTRLRPLTNRYPKPMLPICGRPLFEYGMDLLESAGLQGVGINAYHRAEAFETGFESRPWPITVSKEQELLGTGGGLKRIASLFPRDRFVSINGDALLDCDLEPILNRHIQRGAAATMVLRPVPLNSPFARVGFDAMNRIHKISEVESNDVSQRSLSFSAYTGVQIVEPELLDLVDDGPCDVIRTGYRRALEKGWEICADFVEGLWLDVGTPERYFEANLRLAAFPESERKRWRMLPSASHSSSKSWLNPQVSVGDSVLVGDGVVINSPSILDAGISLENFVSVGSVQVNRSARDSIAYECEGATRYIELK
jgi:mannose-1-phosphate guanylyltransferase